MWGLVIFSGVLSRIAFPYYQHPTISRSFPRAAASKAIFWVRPPSLLVSASQTFLDGCPSNRLLKTWNCFGKSLKLWRQIKIRDILGGLYLYACLAGDSRDTIKTGRLYTFMMLWWISAQLIAPRKKGVGSGPYGGSFLLELLVTPCYGTSVAKLLKL